MTVKINRASLLRLLLSSFIIIGALSIFTLDTLESSRNDFNFADLDFIFKAFLVVSAIFALLIFVSKVLPSKLAFGVRVLTALAFAAAVFSVNWAMVETFILLPMIAIVAICLLAAYLAYIVLELGAKAQGFVAVFVIVLFVISPGAGFLGISPAWFFDGSSKNEADLSSNKTESEQNSEFLDDAIINFDTTPNVYLISFDSIQPKSLTSRYMGLDEVGFHEPIYTRMDRLKNLFSVGAYTKESMNAILTMDMNEYYSAGDKRYTFYSGQLDSRLKAIFRANGYTINTAYETRSFGPEKGPYVDRYHIYTEQVSAACKFNDSKFRNISLFGLCGMLDNGMLTLKRQTKELGFLDFISFVASQTRPQFLIASIYSPGHTKKDFSIEDEDDIAEFHEFYIRRSLTARDTLNQMLSRLEKEDPNAILYVFGDHGPYLTRGPYFAQFEKDPQFFVQDRFGILGAIFPKGRCSTYVDQINQLPVTMSVHGAEAILKCVTAGRYELLDQDYRIRSSVEGISDKFEDYAYE
ncbi:MAG: sulfatase-like hydrolase/transferase [Pseudomonadota bacterium]